MRNLWERETEDEETWEWRDELTPEEAKLVEGWDKSPTGPLRLPTREDFLDALWESVDQRPSMRQMDTWFRPWGRPPLYESRQPSMQEQLDAAAAEAGERNAKCQTVPAAALDAER